MSQKKRLARLFQSNPPTVPGDIRGLFCNRVREISFAVALLQDESLDRIGAIHGESRCGKSHLASRILLAIDEHDLPFVPLQVNANDLGTARGALESVFFQIFRILGGLPAEQIERGSRDGLGYQGVHRQILERMQQVTPLVDGTMLRVTSEDVDQREGRSGADLSVPGVRLQLGEATRRATQVAVEQGLVTERQLAEIYLREAADLLYQITGKRLLLYVDDLDLLARGDDAGQLQRNRLIELLKLLGTTDSVTVLASVRSQYFAAGEGKHFRDFLRVSPLEDEVVREVYHRHIELFNGGEPVFDDDALGWLVDSTRDRIGVFLQLCLDVWRFGFGEDRLLTEEDIRRYARSRLREWREDAALHPIVLDVAAAVERDELEVRIDADLSTTGLLHQVLTPVRVDASGSRYRVNPLYAGILRKGLA